MTDLHIHSIYPATEGEGLLIGTPQTFVRFQGCAIGCLNCDSKETWEFTDQVMPLDQVLQKIDEVAPVKRVSITGGDPLHPKNVPGVLALSKELKERGYYINIEAAGTRYLPEVYDLMDYISFDFKTPSTGVRFNEKVFTKFLSNYSHKCQIKAVVADERDFDAFYQLAQKHKTSDNWVITPCYEPQEEFPMKRFQDIIELNQQTGGVFRVIGQQHKWVFGTSNLEV